MGNKGLEPVETDKFGNTKYTISIENDHFIHFTPLSRAKMIVDSGKLLYNPPFKKFGIASITAISGVWGSYVPTVQTTHTKLEQGDEMVAIVFSTSTVPRIGYAEEVLWDNDVVLNKYKIIKVEQAIDMLKKSAQYANSIGFDPDDDFVVYS